MTIIGEIIVDSSFMVFNRRNLHPHAGVKSLIFGEEILEKSHIDVLPTKKRQFQIVCHLIEKNIMSMIDGEELLDLSLEGGINSIEVLVKE